MQKIAILISGCNNKVINKNKIEAGFNFEYIVSIIRYQFESSYDVDYYVVVDEPFNKSIFGEKLKAFKIVSNKNLKKHFSRKLKHLHDYQFLRRRFLINLVDLNIDYKFFMCLRNDRILVPNGDGFYNKNVKLSDLRGWRRINSNNPISEDKYKLDIGFVDNIDLEYVSCIPYGWLDYMTNKSFDIVNDGIFDGFFLSNWKNMLSYLNFRFSKLSTYNDMPEKRLKKWLLNENKKIKRLDSIYKFKTDPIKPITYNAYAKGVWRKKFQ